MPAVTVTQAAAALGHKSPGQLYRWLKEGRLTAFETNGGNNGRRLELNGLAEHVTSLRRRRIDNVPINGATAPPARSEEVPDYN